MKSPICLGYFAGAASLDLRELFIYEFFALLIVQIK